jgi:hypothetical protein
VSALRGFLWGSKCKPIDRRARKSTSYTIILESNADYFSYVENMMKRLKNSRTPMEVNLDFNPKAR